MINEFKYVDDLKLIKKYYGEEMSHLCRGLFPTILETPGLLFKTLSETFAYSKNLYDYIEGYEAMFKQIIINRIKKSLEFEKNFGSVRKVKDLLSEAGYNFYECHSERDIQKFKKYYAPGEVLCTFKGNRLNRCFVFFAVKKDVNNIKREDFKNPRREDDYGVSVISIQITKDESNTLSIKNRYNHTISNPDATFSNNLDNIIMGLTEAFNKQYGFHINSSLDTEMIPEFVLANDGKYYKYNHEIGNVYFCPDNTILDYFQVKKYDKEKYIIADYFIIDLVNKTINTYPCCGENDFLNHLHINNIQVSVDKETKNKNIVINRGEIIITINRFNQIIGITDNVSKAIGYKYMWQSKYLKEVNMPMVESIGDFFLYNAKNMESISLPSVKIIKDYFMTFNCYLEKLSLPNVVCVGNYFMQDSKELKELDLPNLKIIGESFVSYNRTLKKLIIPNAEMIGDSFLTYNKKLRSINIPNVKKIGDDFLSRNSKIQYVNFPNVLEIGSGFLEDNYSVKLILVPNVKKVGRNFAPEAISCLLIYAPNIDKVGKNFAQFSYAVTVPPLLRSLAKEDDPTILTEIAKRIRKK